MSLKNTMPQPNNKIELVSIVSITAKVVACKMEFIITAKTKAVGNCVMMKIRVLIRKQEYTV